jgi:hypothetical protein
MKSFFVFCREFIRVCASEMEIGWARELRESEEEKASKYVHDEKP